MRLVQRLLLAVALAVAAVFTVPAPANAAGQYVQICFPVGTGPGGVPLFQCHWIMIPELSPKPPWPPECLSCAPQFDFWKDQIDPRVQQRFADLLGQGFGLLAESHLAKDPKLAAELRREATDVLLSAAKTLGDYPIDLQRAGWVDLKTGKEYFEPVPEPWLESTGVELAAGTAILQRALGDPTPQPNIDEALKHFDEAFRNLAELAAL